MRRLNKFITQSVKNCLLVNNVLSKVVPLKIKIVAEINKWSGYNMDTLKTTKNAQELPGDMYVKCPFCFRWDEIITGYNDLPMLWCDGCGARTVLDVSSAVQIDSNLIYKEFARYAYPKTYKKKQIIDALEVDAYFIKRMCNKQLDRLEVVGNYDEKVVRRFMEENYSGSKTESSSRFNNDDIEEYNIRIVPPIKYKSGRKKDTDVYERVYEHESKYVDFDNDHESVYEDDSNYLELTDAPFKAYLTVDSYDLEEPLRPYPKTIDTSHDGAVIYMDLVKVINGKPDSHSIRSHYSGD